GSAGTAPPRHYHLPERRPRRVRGVPRKWCPWPHWRPHLQSEKGLQPPAARRQQPPPVCDGLPPGTWRGLWPSTAAPSAQRRSLRRLTLHSLVLHSLAQNSLAPNSLT